MTYCTRASAAASCKCPGLIFLFALLISLSESGCLFAQGQSNPAFDRGTQGFRNVLHRVQTENEMQVLGDMDQVRDGDEAATMIIVFGRMPRQAMEQLDKALPRGGLKAFVENGGSLLVVSDQYSDRAFAEFGVNIPGTLLVDDNKESTFLGNPACPLLVVSDAPKVPVFLGLSPLATNLPSYLELDDSARRSLTALAYLPSGTHGRNNEPEVPAAGPLFAAGGDVGHGRVLFLADQSMFINEMILQQDLENAGLAYNCVKWSAQSRTRLLYLQDGGPNTDLDVPLEPMPFETQETELAQLADAVLEDIERNDIANELLRTNFPRSGILVALLAFFSVGLAVFALYRLSHVRQRQESGIMPLRLAAVRHGPSRVPVSDRVASLRHQGNVVDLARPLARQFFAVVLGHAPMRPDPKHPPKVQPFGQADEEARLNRELRDLWLLAYGPAPRPISPPAMIDLLEQLRRLRRGLASRHVRLPAVSVDFV